MTLGHVVWRTIRHYRGSAWAVMAGLAVATAVITGSLVIGASLRGSLRDVSLRRLGNVQSAATFSRPISTMTDSEGADGAALLQTSGSAMLAAGEPTPVPVTVWGYDDAARALLNLPAADAEAAYVNAALARDLHLAPGTQIAISLNRPRAVGMDSLFARRKLADVMGTIQLPVGAILADHTPGDLRLDGQSAQPRNIFLSREALARVLGLVGKFNVLLAPSFSKDTRLLHEAYLSGLPLEDRGLKLVDKPDGPALTSAALTLTPRQVSAATATARATGARVMLVSVYLATRLRASSGRQLAYAIIAGYALDSKMAPPPFGDEVELNVWAAQDLAVKPGDVVELTYLVPTPGGTYPTRSTKLRVARIKPMRGLSADSHLMPDYEGMTDAVTLGQWHPPFPVDMSLITDRDERYWEKYRTAPKALVSLSTVRRMWQSGPNPDADHITSVEFLGRALRAEDLRPVYEAKLNEVEAAAAPQALRPVREIAEQAAAGSTDFSQLFLALSMFIIAAGAGLAAMLIRLGVERRTKQIGLLIAIGWPATRVRSLLLRETMLLNIGGIGLGIPLGLLYAHALITAMALRWRAALGDAAAIWLHVTWTDLLIGAVAGLLVGWLTAWLSLRGLARLTPAGLWQYELSRGSAGCQPAKGRAGWKPALLRLGAAMLLATGLLIWGQTGSATARQGAFFGVGFLLLIAALLAVNLTLTSSAGARRILQSLRGLAWRNASLNPRRSLLICGLIASAGFVIIAAAVSTRDRGRADTFDRASGSGGYNLMATTTVPLPYDPATPAGRSNLGLVGEDERLLSSCEIVSMLASPGDDLSCLSASAPNTPRLLGVPPEASFARGLAAGRPPGEMDDAIPCLGDADTVQWRLHLKPGAVWQTTDAYGRPLKLRVAGMLHHSVFAAYLLIGEADLRHLFPDVTAPSVFLIRTQPQDEKAVTAALRRALGDLGLQVRPTREVLAEYAQAQNVYISMFLALGALGLLLGTVGLAVVTARNIIERRAELALLTATGFSRRRVVSLLLFEHGGLLTLGLIVGCAAAMTAMLPQLLAPESSVNWTGLAVALLAVLLVGLGANVFAIRRSLSDDLVGALRHE